MARKQLHSGQTGSTGDCQLTVSSYDGTTEVDISTMARLPKKMNQFSDSLRVYQPSADKPVLRGWFTFTQRKWMDGLSPSARGSLIYVKSKKFMRNSNWNGYINQFILNNQDEVLMFFLTFK